MKVKIYESKENQATIIGNQFVLMNLICDLSAFLVSMDDAKKGDKGKKTDSDYH